METDTNSIEELFLSINENWSLMNKAEKEALFRSASPTPNNRKRRFEGEDFIRQKKKLCMISSEHRENQTILWLNSNVFPNDMWFTIMSFCSLNQLCNMRLVCNCMREKVDNFARWKQWVPETELSLFMDKRSRFGWPITNMHLYQSNPKNTAIKSVLRHSDIMSNCVEIGLSYTDLLKNKGGKLLSIPSSLTKLDLSNIRGINVDDECISYLRSPLLDLDISLSTVTNQGIAKLPTSITKLDISYCDDVNSEAISHLPPKLKWLDVSCSKNLLIENAHLLPTTLTKLYAKRSEKLTSYMLRGLSNHLALKKLKLNECPNLSDDIVSHLPRNLETLSLDGCSHITNKIFETYGSHFPRTLTHLSLSRCKLVTSDIAQLIPSSITMLNIDECFDINKRHFLSLLPTTVKLLGLDGIMVHPLVVAAHLGNISLLIHCIGKFFPSFDTDDIKRYHLSLLSKMVCYASLKGHHEVIKFLIKNIESRNDMSDEMKHDIILYIVNTPTTFDGIHWYSQSDYDIETLKIYPVRNYTKRKPIELACKKYSNVETVRLLIKHGADISQEAVPSTDPSPLWSSVVDEASPEVIEVLLEEHADPNYVYNTSKHFSIIYVASDIGDEQVVSLLLKYGADPRVVTSFGATPLINAVIKKREEIVRQLLKDSRTKEVINHQQNDKTTALFLAVTKGYEDIVEELLKNGADPNIPDGKGMTPLYVSVKKSYTDMLKISELLLKYGANPNEVLEVDGTTPLWRAAQIGNVFAVSLLLKYGARSNISRLYGSTPLYISCQYGHENCVKSLLDIGRADPNIGRSTGTSPLYVASQNGHLDIVQMLLKHGANPNGVCVSENGASIEQPCRPLSVAAFNGHSDIVSILLKYGADILAKDEDGHTPEECSKINRHSDTTEILVKARTGSLLINVNKDFDE